MILKLKIYLKNGIIIEDEVEFTDDATEKDLLETKNYIKDSVKEAMKTNDNGSITFGTTLIRFTEIAAVKFIYE
jgi:hypothetical protein